MSSFIKQQPIKATGVGCLCCGSLDDVFGMSEIIAVGFGSASLTCDGEPVWSEGDTDADMTGEEAEAIAAANPDHDWRISLHGPLRGRVFQRHEPNRWVLIEQDRGFV
jgi:hypothetical protein